MWAFFTFLSLVAICSNTVNSDVQPRLKSAIIGGCFDVVDDSFVHCAAVEDECEKSSRIRFMTANQLRTFGDYRCSTDALPLGTCESTGQCAITADSCAEPNDYRSPSIGECNAKGRFVDGDFVPTRYGACRDGTTEEIICALTPADCSESEEWISASAARKYRKGGCSCHDVRIGVCKDGPHINPLLSDCAISSNDCHPLMQTFGTARDVNDHALLDCRLCLYDEKLVDESGDVPLEDDKTDTSDQEELIKEGNNEYQDLLKEGYKEEQDKLKNLEEEALSRGETAGIVIGAVFAFLLSAVVISACYLKKTTSEILGHVSLPEIC